MKWNQALRNFISNPLLFTVVLSFLLGRAVILDEISPFAFAFFAVLFFVKKDHLLWSGTAMIVGTLTTTHLLTVWIISECLLFLLLAKVFKKRVRDDLSYAPLLVFISIATVLSVRWLIAPNPEYLGGVFVLLEAGLGLVLTLIFAQIVPLFMVPRDHRDLRPEEFIGVTILTASLLLGLADWQFQGLSAEHIISRYGILILALVGGASYGAIVGVITGLVLSLAAHDSIYQISLLSFSGLLAGLLRDGKKIGVAFGLLLGSAILSIYIQDSNLLIKSTLESVVAIIMFLVTPRTWIAQIASFIPGSKEQMKTQHEYTKRVRDLTARRVEQFSQVFRELSGSFMQFTREVPTLQADSKKLISMVADQACVHCPNHQQCWSNQPYQTYLYFLDVIHEVEHQPQHEETRATISPTWHTFCVTPERVLDGTINMLKWYHHDLHLRHQVRESRQLVAQQLAGVSQVMEDLANEIKREGRQRHEREGEIRQSLQEIGLVISQIDILSLDEGNVQIELVLPNDTRRELSRMMIAPLLSSILQENIAVQNEQSLHRKAGYSIVTFGSHKEYFTETGVAMVAKGGDWLSGDSYTTVDIGHGGKFAVAISDGMGNGERAKMESRSALTILEQLLKSGMDETLAIKSVNSILNLRSSDDVYATVDVALIDLYNADTTFMKIGSMPSFIKRHNSIIPISANNLPIGILQEIDVDLIRLQLQPDDLLIMMTDGAFETTGYDVETERWMMKMIAEIDVDDAQCFADLLLERIMRYQSGKINDDMTIVVTRIDRHQTPWAAFRWHNLNSEERERIVS